MLVWLYWPAAPAALLAWALVACFFRDPSRRTPSQPGVCVSPADGRVSDITPLGPDSLLGRDGVQVGVFMSLFDVHVNRSPCDGRVERIEHREGVFLDARDPAASERNESATIFLKTDFGGKSLPVIVRQVAGLVARRIVTDLTDSQTVRRGQRIGMIKFGSRLEVLAPRELAGEVRVRVGQKVRAGQTVLVAAEPGNDTDAQN